MKVSPVVEELVRLAAQAAKADCGSLYLVDESGTLLHAAALFNMPAEYVRLCGAVAVGTQCCGRAVEHNKPWVVNDMLSDPLFADGREAAMKSGFRSGFSVPVRDADNKVIGALGNQYRDLYHANHYDIQRNEMFAQLIGFALSEPVAAKAPAGD